MKNQAPANKSFYKISSKLKNESPQKTERLLKAILKQKRLKTPIGHGGLPPEISQMTPLAYFKRLEFIHGLITHKFHEHIHGLQPGAITTTTAEDRLAYMLQAMNRGISLWKNCLIKNHSVDLLLLDYQIGIEVDGGIIMFSMSKEPRLTMERSC